MAQQLINHGTTPGDGTGESPFSGMQKANANFTELYAAKTSLENAIATKAPINNPTFTGTVNGITKAMVGLTNVDNVADANKPVSTAQSAAIASGDSLRLKVSDVYADFVASGLATPVPVNSLTGVMSVGIAYVSGTRVERVAESSHLYQFSSDTYVDINTSGVITRTPVANGAAAPSLAAGSLRLEKVVTDATKITYVIRIANSAPLLKQGNNTFTVGVGGNFATLQSAFNYVATLPQWTAWTTGVPATGANEVASWAQGSSDCIIDDTNYDLYATALPHGTWFKIAGEDYYYPIDHYDASTNRLVSGIKRIGASITTPTTLTYWIPIRYTLILLDHSYAEFVRIPSNVHVKCVAATIAQISAPRIADANYHGAWNRADAFVSGTLAFGAGITVAHHARAAGPFITNNGALSYNWGVPTTICLEFLQGSRLVNDGSADCISAQVYIGKFTVFGADLLVKSGTGMSHFFHMNVGGDVSVKNVKLHLAPIRRNISNICDLRLFEKVSARKLSIDNLAIEVNDPYNSLSKLVVVGNTGLGAVPLVEVTNVTINCIYANVMAFSVVDEGVVGDDNGSVAGSGVVMMANCHINAPLNTGTKQLYRALTGSTVALKAMRCSGGTLDTPSAGTKTVDNAFAT